MGIFDIFRKKKTAENLSVKTQDSSLTSEEKQNIEILTKNVVDEFSKTMSAERQRTNSGNHPI